MEKNKKMKGETCCTSHRCEILGVIFIAVATVLTLLTFEGSAILGMFIVGVVLCCHKHMGRRCSCGCESCCVPESKMTKMTTTTTAAHHKKPTVKKTTTKVVKK